MHISAPSRESPRFHLGAFRFPILHFMATGRSLLLGRRHRVRFDARFVNLMVAMTVLQEST